MVNPKRVVNRILGDRYGKNYRKRKKKCKLCKKVVETVLTSSKGGYICPDCVVGYGFEVEGDNYVLEE